MYDDQPRYMNYPTKPIDSLDNRTKKFVARPRPDKEELVHNEEIVTLVIVIAGENEADPWNGCMARIAERSFFFRDDPETGFDVSRLKDGTLKGMSDLRIFTAD